MGGIHLHPHDILDEGPAAILERVGKMNSVQLLLPEMNTIFERNPYPSGVLPHNPVRGVVQGTGTFHLRLDTRELSPRLYQTIDPSVAQGTDSLARLLEALEDAPYSVVPWVNLLNGRFEGDLEANRVVDFSGRTVQHWLCPNGPYVVDMWTNVLAAASRQYGCKTFLLDRLRFPDWAGERVNPDGLFSCFCPHCVSDMARHGIDTGALKAELCSITGLLGEKKFDEAFLQLSGSAAIQSWVRFKQTSVSSFIERLIASLRSRDPSIVCWLDLWPPCYAWILGQDYTRLTELAPALKHFPYHKLGGGADVQGLIDCLADEPEQRERAFQAFLKLFGMNYPLSYEAFRRDGFPLRFVADENRKARALSKPGTRIFSGVQMWNLHPDELKLALGEALASDADDVLYYCYGWADEDLFDAVGTMFGGKER